MITVRVGVVVREGLGRIAIVVKEDRRPDDRWLAEQVNEEMRNQPDDVRWWSVMPLTGGMLLLPGPLIQTLREATYEDFLIAVDHAPVEGRRSLGYLFPDYMQRAIASVGRPDTGA